MSASNGHDGSREAVASYALGALSEAERGSLEAHLATCAPCRADLRRLQPAADAVGAAVEPRRPTSRLRRKVIGTARAEARRRRLTARFELVIQRPALAGGVATALLVAGLAGALALRSDDGPISSTVRAQATAVAPGLHAALVREGDSAKLEIRGMDAPGPAHVYQSWVRKDDQIAPSAAFVPDRRGRAVAMITAELDGADEVMITREPAGGRASPSTAPLLRVAL